MCYSNVLVCTRMLLVCTRMLLVGTRMYSCGALVTTGWEAGSRKKTGQARGGCEAGAGQTPERRETTAHSPKFSLATLFTFGYEWVAVDSLGNLTG